MTTWWTLEVRPEDEARVPTELVALATPDLDFALIEDGGRVRLECVVLADTLAEAIAAVRAYLARTGYGDALVWEAEPWD